MSLQYFAVHAGCCGRHIDTAGSSNLSLEMGPQSMAFLLGEFGDDQPPRVGGCLHKICDTGSSTDFWPRKIWSFVFSWSPPSSPGTMGVFPSHRFSQRSFIRVVLPAPVLPATPRIRKCFPEKTFDNLQPAPTTRDSYGTTLWNRESICFLSEATANLSWGCQVTITTCGCKPWPYP